MTAQNNIAWKPIAFCTGALIIGGVIGVFLIAPMMSGQKEKKQKTVKIAK